MNAVPVGLRRRESRVGTTADTAAALGHVGVDVVATTRLILWIEQVAHSALVGFLAEGEVSVGALVEVRHLLPTRVGEAVEIEVVVVEAIGRRVVFEVVVTSAAGIVMAGRHGRGVVERAAFAAARVPRASAGS